VYFVLATGKCREELRDVCFSPHIIRVIKSRIKMGAVRVEHIGGGGGGYKGLGGETRGKTLEDLGLNGGKN